MSVFDDLVGQQPVVAQLQAAADAAGRIVAGNDRGSSAMTHAWLFTGPPGSGRSVAARAFAAALQCEQGGCGHCAACTQALGGTHPDVAVVVPEGLHLLVNDAREVILRSSRAPTRGRWQVTLIEDADRMEERTSNTLLKAVEEPPPHGVLLLCAPSVEDLLPTIRSRCRLVPLRTPPFEAVAEVLVRRDGIDPAMAAFAARAAQGHIGRARRLARDEQARRERSDVLSLPRSLQGIGSAMQAAKDLVDAAQAEAARLTGDRDTAEKEALSTALGGGATGKGYTGGTPRGGAGALKDLEKRQKSRGTRTSRDALDRALVDLAAFYRDVLTIQLRTGTALIHDDLGEQAATIARATSPESTVRRIDAVLACRTALEGNVAPLLAVESMALALRTG
ncbi:MAG: polymerase delta prime subunit [Frankiales bacterium]|jgi:DNA polymerase-3 subunit delta'|nr:polymerase delta prime subunit [Frankiales bacterium]